MQKQNKQKSTTNAQLAFCWISHTAKNWGVHSFPMKRRIVFLKSLIYGLRMSYYPGAGDGGLATICTVRKLPWPA